MLAPEAPIIVEYLPAPQGVQTEAPSIENLPAAQESHGIASCGENFPPVHFTQVEAAVALTTAEYMPGSQAVQDEAAFPENVPATQSKQLLAPGAPEYLPAVQLVHAPVTFHTTVKPVSVSVPSDTNHILRNCVLDVRT